MFGEGIALLVALALLRKENVFPVWTTTFHDKMSATGPIDPETQAVASLPVPRSYMHREILVRVPGKQWSPRIPVLDRGPWYVDDPYFENGERPLAERVWLSTLIGRDVPMYIAKGSLVPLSPSGLSGRDLERLSFQGEQWRFRVPTQPGALDLTPAAFREVPGWDGRQSLWMEWKFAS